MTVSYSKQILDMVTKTIFDRGMDYFKEGRVEKLKIDMEITQAKVSGSEDYDVELGFYKNSFGADCECRYMEDNKNDYCKHIVAVAIAHDRKLGLVLPTGEELNNLTIEEFPHLGKKLSEAYKNPLQADLVAIARATDFSSWTRKHAIIEVVSMIPPGTKIDMEMIKKSFRRINSLGSKYKYDMYFCAGEVTAVTCMTVDDILLQMEKLDFLTQKILFYETVKFYYETYLPMIDGSDGVWEIFQARVRKMATLGDFSDLREKLNGEITGWGDVFEDLGLK